MAAGQTDRQRPEAIKAVFQEYWALGKTQNAFAHALKEQGYNLARGDRRGFVPWITGAKCLLNPWVDIKTREVHTRLTDEKNPPSVDEAKIQITKGITARLETLSQEQMAVFANRAAELEEKRQALVRQYQAERQKLNEAQQSYWQDKQLEWRSNFNKGMRGLFDRDELEHDKSQYQAMREQHLEQLEAERQERNRDRPRLTSAAPTGRARDGY